MDTCAESLQDAFAARAAADRDRIAVCAAGRQLSYGELHRRSSRVADALRERGVRAESRVGLCVERGVDAIVGMLGILKSGAAYVPIDPDYPASRIQYIVDDSAMTAAVSSSQTAACLEECEVPLVDVSGAAGETTPDRSLLPVREHRGSRRHLAYVIYTSGSTGRPKGVLIEHGSVLRLFERTQHLFAFDAADVWAQFHSISFDFSVWEIWGALLTGARLVIIPSRIARSPGELRSLLEQQQVTVLNQTPTAFRQFSQSSLRAGRATTLRLVIFGGEALPPRMLEPWIARYGDERPRLINMYGITETTVHVTHKRITARDLGGPHSPIGVPIDDLRVYLLDKDGRPVPTGMPGRLSVSGPGLARGYWQRPALTAERFVPHVDEGEVICDDGDHDNGDHADARRHDRHDSGDRYTRRYESGDLAIRLATGDLAYLGRSDDQVKVRGYRIEPREVEACLAGHPAVAASVVVPEDLEPDAAGLVAHVMLRGATGRSAAERERIAAALAARAGAELPAYMRPSDYRFVTAFPLTLHGKVDRQALMSGRKTH